MVNKRILVLDFDGVLHSYESGWTKADIVADAPVRGAREFLEDVVQTFEVHVYSARSHQHGGIDAMVRWCQDHFGLDLTTKLHFPNHKPPAFVTLDDRAIRFTGSWPTVSELMRFKPWFKESPCDT